MSRAFIALLTLCAVTAARAADIVTTLHFSPSLAQEANPIVAHFGAGQAVLLGSNLLVVGLFVLLPLFFYWRFPPAPLEPRPDGLRDFVSLQLYDRVLSPREFLFAMVLGVPFPRNRLQVVRCLGFALSWTVVFCSAFAVLSWWATRGWHWEAYQKFRTTIGTVASYPVMEVAASIPVFFLLVWLHFRAEHRATAG